MILAGVFALLYAVGILFYVATIPDLGLRSAFSPQIKATPRQFEGTEPQAGDVVEKIADREIQTWALLLAAPFAVRDLLADPNYQPEWAKRSREDGEETVKVSVQFRRGEHTFTTWCHLGRLPIEELIPSVLWFFLKVTLFLVGALVLWQRPRDGAAAQFFLLCIVTLCAFMGGYHWSHIATQPTLLLVFMVSAVMLPVVSLHFYQVFPRRKPWLQSHPRWGFGLMYGVPVAFLATLVILYSRQLWSVRHGADPELIAGGLELIRRVIYGYLLVALLMYLLCVVALVHSLRTARDVTEKMQVQWILFGAVLALAPIGYSFYLAFWQADAFAAGAATWPMFAASACLTAAFAISITRYRLMELDQIISSSMGYFAVSFSAALIYYAVVFVGTLMFSQLAGPKLSDAITVSATALVLMLILDVARGRLRKALDRRFSRHKSQLDLTLQRMRQAVEQLVDPPALAQRLLHASTELLGVRRGAVYLRQGEPARFCLVGAVGPPPALAELPADSPLVELLAKSSVIHGRLWPGTAPSLAHKQLYSLGGEVAQALAHEGRVLALLLLGAKDSPYRPEDLDLLAAFAQITVLALESADGHRTIEQLNGELQAKVEKISEQQRRIMALQSQLRRQSLVNGADKPAGTEKPADPSRPDGELVATPGGIVGSSGVVHDLLHLVRKVATTDAVVLIRGESGTGKELLARAVHETSARAAKAFVKVHCAALSAGLLESELFGHVKGAFTGAHRDKVGRFELANGGTLFLDEIGDISLEVQTKLLRVLQENMFERVGSSDPVNVDVRIIAATHQNLEALIRQGRFREDLYYRLNVFPILMPPLRQRIEDIPELAMHFMRLYARRCRKEIGHIDDDVLVLLKSCPWPGNIRQLENLIERAVVVAEGPVITMHEIPQELLRTTDAPLALPASATTNGLGRNGGLRPTKAEREQMERDELVQALATAAGNKAEAARALGLARSTFLSKLKKFGLG